MNPPRRSKKSSSAALNTAPSKPPAPEHLGLALGSGSARGWCHIGILRGLEAMGIRPGRVAGCSMGALVGAAYVTGNLDALEDWARSLRRVGFLRLVDIRVPGGGLVQGQRLLEELRRFIPDVPIESLERPFAAVSTDLATGREVWMQEGSLLEAVRASIAVPGLFTPFEREGTWLVDGGLVDPVPISLCRALGARMVIGVNPFGDRISRYTPQFRALEDPALWAAALDEAEGVGEEEGGGVEKGALRRRATRLLGRLGGRSQGLPKPPGLVEVLVQSLNIMQDRLIRSRMAGDPPEVLLSPRLGHIALLEFDQAADAIAEGEATVRRMEPVLREAVAPSGPPQRSLKKARKAAGERARRENGTLVYPPE